MTCIVGYADKKNVYIGGDSAGVAGYDLSIRADEKVFRNKDFIFGFTSSFRMGQILRYSFEPPSQSAKKSVYKYMCSDFIDKVREQLKSGGYLHEKDNVQSGGTFIVGYKKQLFIVENDFQVAQTVDNFAAVGCGADYAKGVLWELRRSRIGAREKIIRALQAAEHFSAGVHRPFKIIKL